MANLTIKQKREWAATLYLKENLTQAEIAEKVGTSRQTINNWIKADKWKERKTAITLTREEQVKHLYRQIEELNDKINGREKGQRHATPAEADIIAKLSNAIKKMETDVGIADMVGVGTRFINWLRNVDFEKAKDVTWLFDAFIKDNL
ncbi:helix-turn-helix domain-containing protein [Parabacteroides sp. PF5-9]|uniref:helix-turn-helix domain-containing protein n=1 Tax=Parabacteroides sp. PF5-9 TaxID=1742404 RepID=UPI002475A609|nr:helix-turn-helix domain-containing protein [Parabacteroides sp. PF5-9]MDH6357235.1 uncharacterized protein YjcR [Parabacteroides sp. PF5-9]